MFSYYGSKSKVVHLYPKPKHDKIIEPFAGSARYSLKYFDRDVLLVDKYEVIVKIWKWLQKCTAGDIKQLPDLGYGDDIRKFTFDCDEARDLMRFMIGGGLAHPQWIVSPQGFGAGVASQKKKIINNLHKIKHWTIQCGDYRDIPNTPATWFIDPPYQFGGHKYVHNNKDFCYSHLAEWCTSRNGQIIVCENTKANWLLFYPMRSMNGANTKTTEAIWSNHPHDFMARQQELFT
jgi:site-specific DNA-adenine methylase